MIIGLVKRGAIPNKIQSKYPAMTTCLAGVLKDAEPEIQMRQLCHFFRADPDYGGRIASKLGIEIPAELMQHS